MATLEQLITDFFATPAGQAVLALLALAALDFVLGVFAAARDGAFRLDALGAWLRKHVAGRVMPITAVLLVGHLAGGLSFDAGDGLLSPGVLLSTAGLAMAGTYVLEVIGSVRESLTPDPNREAPGA